MSNTTSLKKVDTTQPIGSQACSLQRSPLILTNPDITDTPE